MKRNIMKNSISSDASILSSTTQENINYNNLTLTLSSKKLTNTDIDILKILIQNRLSDTENNEHFKPEILEQISKKLDRMYFL